MWNACEREANWILRWIECHPGLAGYIQAIGVVITIIIAVLGPPLARYLERRKARAARKDLTNSIIQGAVPSVAALLERIDGRLSTIGTYGDVSGPDANLVLENLGIPIPASLDMLFMDNDQVETSRLDFLDRLNKAARKYNMLLSEIRTEGVNEKTWPGQLNRIRTALDDLKWQTSGALGTMAKS